MSARERLGRALLRQPHPRTDLRAVYGRDAPVAVEELAQLERARDAPLTDYPEPRWWGVWSRPYGDALVGPTRQP